MPSIVCALLSVPQRDSVIIMYLLLLPFNLHKFKSMTNKLIASTPPLNSRGNITWRTFGINIFRKPYQSLVSSSTTNIYFGKCKFIYDYLCLQYAMCNRSTVRNRNDNANINVECRNVGSFRNRNGIFDSIWDEKKV